MTSRYFVAGLLAAAPDDIHDRTPDSDVASPAGFKEAKQP
jgi:hypothetical protein